MIQSLLQQIEDELIELDAKASAKQDELERRNKDVAEAEKELLTIEEALKVENQRYLDEKSQLEKASRPLKKEAQHLSDEISTLTDRKGDLMLANSKLEQQNKDFIEYEQKAWKVLDAKDQELQAREHNLSEKENLSPRAKTFLPSV